MMRRTAGGHTTTPWRYLAECGIRLSGRVVTVGEFWVLAANASGQILKAPSVTVGLDKGMCGLAVNYFTTLN
jgi:hypothetical protein